MKDSYDTAEIKIGQDCRLVVAVDKSFDTGGVHILLYSGEVSTCPSLEMLENYREWIIASITTLLSRQDVTTFPTFNDK